MASYPGQYGEDRFHLRLEEDHPHIEWRPPIIVKSLADGFSYLGCRYCIAGFGLKGADLKIGETCFNTPDEFAAHMLKQHPLTEGDKRVDQ